MASADSGQSVEEIPDEDQITHCRFDESDDLAPETYFAFEYDKDRDERAESVFWRKHVPKIEDIHERGCKLQLKWFYLFDPGPTPKYCGARTAQVAAVRRVVTGRGHRFRVIHYPQDGDVAHAHIAVERAGGKPKNLSKTDRMELTALLVKCFGDLEQHECANTGIPRPGGQHSGPNEGASGGALG